MHDQIGEQAARVFVRAEHGIEPQRRHVNSPALGRVAAEHCGRDFGDSVVAVGLDGFTLGGGVVLEPVFRGRARVDECLEAGLQAGCQQAHRPLDVSAYHLLQVGLPGVGAMCCKVEYPVGPDLAHDAGDGLRVMEQHFMKVHLCADLLDAPRLVIGPHQQMEFVAVAQQSPREVGAHEAGSAGQDNAFHRFAGF